MLWFTAYSPAQGDSLTRKQPSHLAGHKTVTRKILEPVIFWGPGRLQGESCLSCCSLNRCSPAAGSCENQTAQRELSCWMTDPDSAATSASTVLRKGKANSNLNRCYSLPRSVWWEVGDINGSWVGSCQSVLRIRKISGLKRDESN